MNSNNALVFGTIGFNMALGIADRLAQICYVAMTDFITSTIQKTAITFCVLPSAINCFMILIYVIFHNEDMHTTKFKIKIFFLYLISGELVFPIGVHRSFKSKFSANSDKDADVVFPFPCSLQPYHGQSVQKYQHRFF